MAGPTTVREAVAKLILRWDGDAMDYESERRAFIEVTNGEGELLLPRGPQGDAGNDGEPGPGLAPDLVLNYPTDGEADDHLPTGLADGDRGYCVINDPTNTGWFWSGENWLVVHDVVGAQGDIGPSVGFTIGTVTTSPSGGSAQVSIDPSSTATNKVLNFVLPRGNQGAVGVGQKGDPGDALSGAGDVDMAGGPSDGDVLVYDTTIGKWRPMTFVSGPVGPYGLGPNDFSAINDGSWPQDYKVIAHLSIGAQGFAWHPRVFAQCDVKLTGIQARVDLEARLGSPTGPVVGRGPGNTVTTLIDNYYPRDLSPAFEGGPMTPESTSYSVPKGAVGDIYIVLRRIDTLATFGVQTRKDRASMVCYCDPIPGSET